MAWQLKLPMAISGVKCKKKKYLLLDKANDIQVNTIH